MLHRNPIQRRQEWQRHEGIAPARHMLDGLCWRVYGVDDALMIASIAATTASAGAGMQAQSEARKATGQARTAELLRQQEYQRQAAQVADESLAKSTRQSADQNLDTSTEARKAAYARITTPQTATATAVPQNRTISASPTATATAQNTALTSAWNRILGGAQARLGAYDDWGLSQAVKDKRAAEKLGVIGGNARGSAGVLSSELDNALHAGDNWNTVAGALGMLGNLGGTYVATTPRG